MKKLLLTQLQSNVSGAGNGHSIGTDKFTLDGKDDVIGSYTIDQLDVSSLLLKRNLM